MADTSWQSREVPNASEDSRQSGGVRSEYVNQVHKTRSRMQSQIRRNMTAEEVMKLAKPCSCEACRHGCTMGSGVLAEGDKERLARYLGITEQELEEKYLEKTEQFNRTRFRPRLLRKGGRPYGRCVFYDDKEGCAVHEAKPLQCRTAMGCKDYGEDLATWFAVNHLVDSDDPESVRQYEAALKGGMRAIQGGKVEDIVPDKNRLRKIRSFEDH